ncbi:geranylgeranyl reductase family protein [Candidatus Thorarchaeota archaeon]|nr:MAG: geranylgeranyl reductase family protein [Candidatus Thorarchaeota archaeon]
MYDLLVIGGGPGGATCARRAAMKGLDVVLIEKKVFSREKACGGALSPRVINTLDFDISKIIERRFEAAMIHRPSGQKSILTRDDFKGHLIQRGHFDKYLLDKAKEAGVEVVEGTDILAIDQLRKGIRALSVGDSFKGHLLVGADGVNGISMKRLGIRNRWQNEEIAVCISAEVLLEPSEVERLMTMDESHQRYMIELYFGITEWGYGWCFPKMDRLSIGLGCRVDKAKHLRDKWIKFLTKLENQKGIRFKLTKKTSFRVPLGGIQSRYIGRRSMLIGDAAGLVSPVSGEGISFAIESGILAAEVAVESVQKKSPVHIIEYDRRLKKGLLRELRNLRFIAGIMHKSNENIERICSIADDDPVMREYLTDILARINTYSNLKLKITKQLLTHHPLKAIRLGL